MRLTSVCSMKGPVHKGKTRIARFDRIRLRRQKNGHCCLPHSMGILGARFDANALLRSSFVGGVAKM